MTRQRSSGNLTLGGPRELGTVGLVAGLSGAYAAVLIMAASILETVSLQSGDSVGYLLGIVSGIFILIALYVAAIVMSGAVDTVIAGRLRHIALLRLLGSTSRDLRRSVMRATAVTGAIGAAIGIVAGALLTHLVRLVLVARDTLPAANYDLIHPQLVVAFVAIVSSAAAAGWLGSRGVLRVSPATALAGASAYQSAPRQASLVRAIVSGFFLLTGFAVLVLGALIGESDAQSGFLLAFLGAAASGTGFLIGARFVIPGVVGALSRLLGNGATAKVARRNALLDPLRTTRSTMGLVVGIALVTTIAAGMSALQASVNSWVLDATERDQAQQVLGVTSTILICLIVISSLIAAVGFVSTMSLTVIQRHREIGLLRALGFTQHQVRAMITAESVALSASAVIFGCLIGLVYGTLGAQALVGEVTDGLVWGLPLGALAAIAVAGVVLVLVSSQRPARRAVAVTPVEALRIVS